MRWVLCLMMLAALGFAPAPVYRPKPADIDLDLLQGKWDFVSSADEGRPATREEGRFIVVQGSTLAFQDGRGVPTRQYRIAFGGSKQQRTLGLYEVGESVISQTPHVGLYRIRGDEFVFSFGTTRGVAATSLEGGRGMRRLVFKRYPKP